MKTNEELVKDFIKSNKERRKKTIAKAGFTTSEEYLESLIDTPTGSPEASKLFKKNDAAIAGTLDMVVAFDTTGSMSYYLEQVKKHITELIPKMFKENPELKMKIIAFGDYCDMRGKDNFGLAYQESSLTNDQKELINFTKTAAGTSGGDSEEFYELVIKKIVEETPWRNGKRSVLLIADYDPHPLGYCYGNIVNNSQIDWRHEAKKAAEKEIAFDTLAIHGNRFPWYKELANITNGIFMPFQSSEKTEQVLYATTSARGGLAGARGSAGAFYASMSATMSSGDTELTGTYKSLSTLADTKDGTTLKAAEELLKRTKK